MTDAARQIIHATCLSIAGCGVLVRGSSGSGKSDLALRMIDRPGRGLGDMAIEAVLVADDRVVIRREGCVIMAWAPDALKGLIEVRGQGVLPVTYAASTEVKLVVDLVGSSEVERMPDEPGLSCSILGVDLPNFKLAPFDASAPAKLRIAVASLNDSRFTNNKGAYVSMKQS